MNDHSAGTWDISEGIADPERFFALLPALFPDATHLYVEGSSIAPAVRKRYEESEDSGRYLPGRQTLWPPSKVFRLEATPELFQSLSTLAASHAPPELLHHLSLYRGDRPLLVWHDAFANAMLLDGDLPEETVAELAAAFDCEYGRARSRRWFWTRWFDGTDAVR